MRLHYLLLFIITGLLCGTACRQTPEITEPAQPAAKTVALNPGDTLGQSLQDSTTLPPADRTAIVQGLGKVFNLRQCRDGDTYRIDFDTDSRWQRFSYYPPGLDYFEVARSTAGVVAARLTRAARREVVSARGTIRTSLWEAMASQKVEPDIIVDFADIFAWQVDFLTETRADDAFKVVYEQHVADNGAVVSRQILGAQFIASGKEYTAILFTGADGRKDYFTPDGKSLRSAFLRAPLQYRRISSFFTRRRFHPVLKYFRPHLGIDYAAPKGTPVSAIGEGTVTYAGRKGGYGNYVAIRHMNGYSSFYGHLSRYGKGIRRGTRVHQGQVVAYVGSTGLSSGPHLDFRVSLNGKFVNFLTLKFPAAQGVPAAEHSRFAEVKRDLFTRLAQIK